MSFIEEKLKKEQSISQGKQDKLEEHFSSTLEGFFE